MVGEVRDYTLACDNGESYTIMLAKEIVPGLLAPQPETAPDADEVAHVVGDDSDDPEHVDDCPGCDEEESEPGFIVTARSPQPECPGFESNPVAPGLCGGCYEPEESHALAPDRRPCGRTTWHPAHRFMLGRRVYQCPGVEQPVPVPEPETNGPTCCDACARSPRQRAAHARLAAPDAEPGTPDLAAAIRAIHREVDGSPHAEGSCIEDGQDYPCATLRALHAGQPVAALHREGPDGACVEDASTWPCATAVALGLPGAEQGDDQ